MEMARPLASDGRDQASISWSQMGITRRKQVTGNMVMSCRGGDVSGRQDLEFRWQLMPQSFED